MLPELSEHLVSSCNGAQDLAKQIRPDSGGASAGQSFRRASLKRQYFLIVRWAKDLDAIVYLWGRLPVDLRIGSGATRLRGSRLVILGPKPASFPAECKRPRCHDHLSAGAKLKSLLVIAVWHGSCAEHLLSHT
mmetsp:Transcript_30399/g.71502  ORF Transcript_30399/g.71502 Transcript_30399/m.71502 type:complete len:134 (+) Transcript_30399:164-565(+)